jgi:zinc/manganese transport system substrate-binding protein
MVPVAAAEVRVVTTTPSYADITRRVGGDHVSVEAVMRGPENVHNVSPTPSQMMKLKKADLWVHSGLDAEPWAPLLVKGARNPRLLPGQPGDVDVSRGIALREVPGRGGLTRALGDIHIYGNTHFALDPLNGVIIGRTIADALQRADPSHAEEYEANYMKHAKELRELTDRLIERIKPYRGARIVTYHRSWVYFLERFGLQSIGEIEPRPGIAPGPQHLRDCVQTMKAQRVRVIVVEAFNSRRDAEVVAERVGGVAVVLAHDVGAVPGVDSYGQVFEHNIDVLIEAFREVGFALGGSADASPAPADAGAASRDDHAGENP